MLQAYPNVSDSVVCLETTNLHGKLTPLILKSNFLYSLQYYCSRKKRRDQWLLFCLVLIILHFIGFALLRSVVVGGALRVIHSSFGLLTASRGNVVGSVANKSQALFVILINMLQVSFGLCLREQLARNYSKH